MNVKMMTMTFGVCSTLLLSACASEEKSVVEKKKPAMKDILIMKHQPMSKKKPQVRKSHQISYQENRKT